MVDNIVLNIDEENDYILSFIDEMQRKGIKNNIDFELAKYEENIVKAKLSLTKIELSEKVVKETYLSKKEIEFAKVFIYSRKIIELIA